MSRYLKGVDVLGAGRPSAEEVVGANWAQVLYNPAGIAYDYYNTGSARSANLAAAANPYWAQQRAAVGPIATGNAARVQAAQAMQAQLRAQQAAQIAAMRAQAASLPSTPPSTMPSSAPSASPPATSDPGSGGGQPDSSAPSTDDSGASADSSVVGGGVADQFVVIRVKNLAEVVKKQGGALGNMSYSLLPGFVSDMAYSKMRDQLKSKFAEQGVDADVTVTATPPTGAPPRTELRGIAVGAGAVGIGWAIWQYFLKRSR